MKARKNPRQGTGGKNSYLRILLPAAAALLLCFALFSLLRGDESVRVMSGMVFRLPENFAQRYSDSRYAVYEYTGKDKNPGKLILDAEIRDGKAQSLNTVEEVLRECDWMTDAEIYVNPQGVRMARGFADYAGSLERRYYIETQGAVLLMCMIEDERFYSREDCEEAMLHTAESVRPVK